MKNGYGRSSLEKLGSGALRRLGLTLVVGVMAWGVAGCGGAKAKKENQTFFTSGSREADQRASQRMAKAEQLSGSEEGSSEKKQKAEPGTGKPAQSENKLSLFDRLGGEKGLAAIVNDFTPRVIQDPRVDWQRKGVKRGGLFRRGPAVAWQSTPNNVARLKLHMVQFLTLATGGPARYEGKEMKLAHQGMHITNPEFDAAVGDLKASLDNLKISNQEQKELLAIIESTRPQIVTER